MPSSRIPDAVRRVFAETFAVGDVAEPLASFDASIPAAEALAFMKDNDFDVLGVRKDGHVVGYVERGSLGAGKIGSHLRPLENANILDDSTSLLDVLTALNRTPFVLVRAFGQVAGIVTRTDLQKAPVRMWLFGLVTLIEMRFSELIERHCPADEWKKYVSEGRLQKAESLLQERQRRNQRLTLFDCLQFSDKGQVIARNEDIRKLTVFSSRNQTEDAIKRLEQLRNNLAHAQDILGDSDWSTIVQLCEFVARE